MGGDVKAFVLSYAVAEFVGLGLVLDFPTALAVVAIDGAEPGVSQGKVGVELDGMLIKRYSFVVAFLVASFFPFRERFQCRQRLGGGLFQWFVELLDGRKRFTQLAAQTRCGLAERSQYRFLALRLFLILRDGVAVAGVDGVQGDYILGAELRDVAHQYGLGGGSLGEIARYFSCKAFLWRAAHELQCRVDFLFWHDIQERRLAEVHLEGLL